MLSKSDNETVRRELSDTLDELRRDRCAMDQHVANMLRAYEAIDQLPGATKQMPSGLGGVEE